MDCFTLIQNHKKSNVKIKSVLLYYTLNQFSKVKGSLHYLLLKFNGVKVEHEI